jgi:threonylcarbamoyladenosine tRNA methylthiotransferase MtaB
LRSKLKINKKPIKILALNCSLMKKVAFYTLGCKLNFAETSSISRNFETHGFKKVEFTDQPDIFVINTCSVTDHADKKCRKIVKEARRISPDAFVAIVGCYAQLKPTEIAAIPGVDAVLGAAEKFRLVETLKTFERPASALVIQGPIDEVKQFNEAYSYQDRTRTFLKVQDGCNYNCSFCTIPLARGSSRSSTIAEVVDQARQIARTEVKEVVLTGVNIGDFGIINGRRKERFIDLIKALDEIEGIERFRISSIEPNLLSEEMIQFVSGSKRFVPHFHLPLQSGSDAILKAMRRRYDSALYESRVQMIRSLMPNACIGVDVITGFPGETEVQFRETYQFLNELDISYLHVFTYSERPNTHAVTLQDVVAQKLRNERTTMLRTLSEKKRRLFYEGQLGRVVPVLFEQEAEGDLMFGFSDNYVKVEAKYDPLLVNTIKQVRLTGFSETGNVCVEEPELELLKH